MKAIVSFSGGIDSTTCLALAIKKYGKENVKAVSVTYGQKHIIEVEKAKAIAEYYDVELFNLNLTNIFSNNKNCSLLSNNDIAIEEGSYDEQYNNKNTSSIATAVPFRNGLFVTSLVSYAQSLYPEEELFIYLGNHKDSETGVAIYADCSKEFTDTLNKAIEIGTNNLVHLVAPFADYTKDQIVKDGLEMNVPYNMTWSCYNGGINGKPCLKCATCIDCIKAFAKNGIDYEKLFEI